MQKPLRILRLITRMNIGGPSIHMGVLSRGIRQINGQLVENHIAYGNLEHGESDMSDVLSGSGATVHSIPELRQQVRPFDDFVALVKLIRLMRAVKPDIVHTHTAKAGILGRIAAWLTGCKIIVHTYHGHSFSGYFSKLFSAFFKTVDRFLNKRASAVIAISPKLSDELCDTHHVVSREKLVVIPLGLPLAPFFNINETQKQTRVRFNLPEDKIIIGCVGRMVPIKNHVSLISAWAKQSREFRQKFHLVILGDGPEMPKIQNHILSHALQDTVRCVPFSREVPAYLRSFDHFILPSINEGTPVTILEAMAARVPVLASMVGGVPDLLGTVLKTESSVSYCERGVGFDPDANQIAEAIKQLATNVPPAQQLDRAQNFAKSYSDERLVADITQLYEKLLEEHA